MMFYGINMEFVLPRACLTYVEYINCQSLLVIKLLTPHQEENFFLFNSPFIVFTFKYYNF